MNTKKFLLPILAFCLFVSIPQGISQKKVLDHLQLATWNQISSRDISPDGGFITYQVKPNEGDSKVCLYTVSSGTSTFFERGSSPKFTYDGKFLVFRVSPPEDTLKALRRKKVETDDLPGDTLYMVDPVTAQIERVAEVRDYTVSKKPQSIIAYRFKPVSDSAPDSTGTSEKDDTKEKSYSEDNGFPLVIYQPSEDQRDTLDFVTSYKVAEENLLVVANCSGRDSTLTAGVYALASGNAGWRPIRLQKGSYDKLTVDKYGRYAAFVGDLDTSKAQIRPYDLFTWQPGQDSSTVLISHMDNFIPDDWLISHNRDLTFSDDGKSLFFGIAPPPVLQDTSLLEEEIVNVEVWHYLDDRVYTQQNVLLDEEKKKSYLTMVDLETGTPARVADEEWPEAEFDRERKAGGILLYREKPYLRAMSWDGFVRKDIAYYDYHIGEMQEIATGIHGDPGISPGNKYVYWYNLSDSLWHIYSIEYQTISEINLPQQAYDELNDLPTEADPYGSAGWTDEDRELLLYDRYDIWSVKPGAGEAPRRLTNGRESNLRYRLIDLDPENLSVDTGKPLLLSVFNEQTKASGYALLDYDSGKTSELAYDNLLYDRRPLKARESDAIVYTYESFTIFPDLRYTEDWFRSSRQISNVNPQQAEYNWGTAELFEWTAYDGKRLQGIIVKPENFDPDKKYPMLVNFYERSSDELYEHRTPYPHRSTINYSFYASRGYVIFNPDVVYDIGHPGASAYNCVISGVEAVVNLGYVDTDHIGVQGHSWGGYQVADLITRTDIFACAEAGAPLVNMINAYGGIRWQTGLSRMFQYEHTQSRLGVTPWENIDLYIENSPFFNLDKVNTPVLILHDDKDGHVPWHLGVEYFVAMRRLGKPAWLLNYNGEPHWPLKVQNRKDFNIRLQQYFDYFLKGAPMPLWMRDGVSPVNKGINQGYELIKE